MDKEKPNPPTPILTKTGIITSVQGKRGRGPGSISIADPDGEVIEVTSFDPQKLREAAEAMGGQAEIKYVEKPGKDEKTYLNMVGIEIVAPAPSHEPTGALQGEIVGDTEGGQMPGRVHLTPAIQAKSELELLEEGFNLAVRQRELLEGFIKGRFVEGKHYYPGSMFGSKKPVLSQEGAQLIRAATSLRIVPKIIAGPLSAPDDLNTKYTILVEAEVYNRFNEKVGGALGSASSHIWSSRSMSYKPRAADHDKTANSTVKMAVKRAYVAAVRANTAAAEFFSEDLEEGGYTDTPVDADGTPSTPPKKGFIRKP